MVPVAPGVPYFTAWSATFSASFLFLQQALELGPLVVAQALLPNAT